MPTPVSTARQCLTTEAAQALDEAVTVARRRGHAQTTSLHAVSALLSLPSSALREACGRARNSAYSARIQFKALELCLGVSLDRLPSSPQRAEEPPVSNSLMAAIKRSQANQRRQPESFHLYQQQQQSSSVSTVKVELQNLILSVLDDPVVSRVFSEAGFRSCDIKLAILRPVHQLLRYSRYRGPPLFLCNLTGDSDLGRSRFSFPFLGFSGVSNGDENCRRIGEVLVRNKARNPLLVGVCANDALQNFRETVERRKGECVLPVEIYGLNVIRIENDVSKFVNENSTDALMKLRFAEVAKMLEHCIGPGVVISYGDLKELIGDDASVAAAASWVVGELTRLLDLHGGKLWLIGAAATYETYLKFLNRFPSVEKDWDLQLLPITSLRSASADGDSYPRSSLMKSFVPFGGFFCTSSELKSPLGGSYQCLSRCHLCNEKCEQEISAIAKDGFTCSVAEQYQSSLPSWLQMTELNKNSGLDVAKAKDDGLALNAKVKGLQRKWDNICQRLHHAEQLTKGNMYQVGSQVPAVAGFQVGDDKKENADDYSSNERNTSSNASGCRKVTSCMSMDIQKSSRSQESIPLPGVSKAMDANFQSKMREKTSECEDLELGGLRSPPLSFSNSSVGDGHTSPLSAASVTTDLGLGIYSASTSRELKKPTNQTRMDLVQDFSGCLSANVDLVTASSLNHPAQSSSCSCPVFDGQLDQRDFKMLYRALSERISWQEEAVSAISRAIAHCRTRNEKRFGPSLRGDIWFTFLGPDRLSKKRIAVALAKILNGSKGNFICVDLSSQDGMMHTNTIYDHQELNGYEVRFRGKTVVDYVAGELIKNPLSVVFLENIDEADPLAQNRLSQAVMTGRFSDSHGREVGINSSVFVTTSTFTTGSKCLSSAKETSKYSEENILRTKGWPIQMVINCAVGNGDISNDSMSIVSNNTRKGISNPVIMNKRKSIGTSGIIEECETLEMAKRAHKVSNLHLDLNLPAEENEIHNTNSGNSESDSVSENSKVWLEDFVELVDETVVFKPFDFDKLAEKISKQISKCFHQIVGPDCLLEIDSKVMEQILAAACLSENNEVEDWVEQVVSRGFVEAQKRYNLTPRYVVKLATREGLFSEGQAPGVRLPARIVVN